MESTHTSKRLYGVKEAASYLGVRSYTVRRLVHAGTLPRVELSRTILIDIADLEKLIENRKNN